MKRAFTLLEVMIALALLGFALVVLMRSTANNISSSESAHMMGIATDLARGKMYEIEEVLLHDGFSDTDQSQLDPKPFDDLGWPNIKYSYKVEVVEMPTWDNMQALASGHAAAMGSGSAGSAFMPSAFGSGSGSGSGVLKPSLAGSSSLTDIGLVQTNDPLVNFQNSMLGGMMTMMGGFGASGASGATAESAGAASLIQSQYTMFQQILKVSVRKVTLTVTYKTLGNDRDLTLVAFYTDPSAMDQVLSGAGAVDGSGSSGSGTGSSATTAKTTSGGSGSTSK